MFRTRVALSVILCWTTQPESAESAGEIHRREREREGEEERESERESERDR
jgi:hypothetical protein